MRTAAIVLAAILAWSSGQTARSAPTTAFTLSGDVAVTGSYDLAALQALPAATQTVTYLSGPNPVTDTFTGPLIWTLLQAAGGIKTDPAVKNGVLRTYVVATGSDGYKTVIATGEIAPRFGHKPDLIAYADTNGRLPVPDGFARIVAAGDVAGGRYVSNLDDLRVGTAPNQPATGGGTTTEFTVHGGVATQLTYTLAELQALPSHTETVTYMAGSQSVTDTYTGALLWDVLNAAGLLTDPTIKNDILRKAVVATGSDGYQVTFALGELSPRFGNEPILVAYADALGQLGPGGSDGFARLVVPGDIAGGRYVSNLTSFFVFDATAVPEPATVYLLLASVVATLALGGLSRRRGIAYSGFRA